MVGWLHLALHGKAQAGKGGLGHGLAVGLVRAEGDPAVEAALQAGLAHLQQGEGQGERAGNRVRLGDPKGRAGAVPVGKRVFRDQMAAVLPVLARGRARSRCSRAVTALLPPSGREAWEPLPWHKMRRSSPSSRSS